MANDKEVEEDLALRREQASVTCFALGETFDIVGYETLKQFLAVGAGYAHDAAVGKSRYHCGTHRLTPRLQTGRELRMRGST
ncbi:MAG TPA: hypothetical protein PKE16_16740 [Hyphomicrobium sp.]|nr:hypothetical protein [Hyphomicrobium sp.]